MGFKKEKKDDFEKEALLLKDSECDAINTLVKQYGTRYELLKAHHAIRFTESGEMIVMSLSGAVGSKMGIGEHTYDTDLIYFWWQDAFSQVDKYLYKKEFAIHGERVNQFKIAKINEIRRKLYGSIA